MSMDKAVEGLTEAPVEADTQAIATHHIKYVGKRAAILGQLWPDEPIAMTALANNIRRYGQPNLGPGTLRRLVNRLVADGLVLEVGHSRYTITSAGVEWLEQYNGQI